MDDLYMLIGAICSPLLIWAAVRFVRPAALGPNSAMVVVLAMAFMEVAAFALVMLAAMNPEGHDVLWFFLHLVLMVVVVWLSWERGRLHVEVVGLLMAFRPTGPFPLCSPSEIASLALSVAENYRGTQVVLHRTVATTDVILTIGVHNDNRMYIELGDSTALDLFRYLVDARQTSGTGTVTLETRRLAVSWPRGAKTAQYSLGTA